VLKRQAALFEKAEVRLDRDAARQTVATLEQVCAWVYMVGWGCAYLLLASLNPVNLPTRGHARGAACHLACYWVPCHTDSIPLWRAASATHSCPPPLPTTQSLRDMTAAKERLAGDVERFKVRVGRPVFNPSFWAPRPLSSSISLRRA
jgi:hypothetical protein